MDIPSGVVVDSFNPVISKDGQTITFDCYMEKSRYDPIYTMDPDLIDTEILVRMQSTLQQNRTSITRKKTDGSEVRDYRT